MKIGIVGTRSRNSKEAYDVVRDALLPLLETYGCLYGGVKIISGGCPKGADRFAEALAIKYQIPITIYYAPWDRIGKSAGYHRNTNIAADSDLLIACVASNRKGGTEDTIEKFVHKDYTQMEPVPERLNRLILV